MYRIFAVPAVLVAAALLSPSTALSQPSTAQCMKMIEPAVPGEKGLECKFKGGQRSTNELNGKKYLTPVGKCWDYDTVVIQSCGCRKFLKASICCRNGSTKECEWRVGKSEEVDCAKWKQPKFGLSGNTESPACAEKRKAKGCVYTNLKNPWYYPDVGPCFGESRKGGVFECESLDAQSDFANDKCGPDPVSCGCTLKESCSDEAWVACYKEFIGSPEGLACFDITKPGSAYDKTQCWEAVKAKAKAAE